jgi:hypothetical protein
MFIEGIDPMSFAAGVGAGLTIATFGLVFFINWMGR